MKLVAVGNRCTPALLVLRRLALLQLFLACALWMMLFRPAQAAVTVTQGSVTISADTYNTVQTTSYIVVMNAAGDIDATGSYIFNAPTGFQFDLTSSPTATLSSCGGGGSIPTFSYTSGTATALTFNINGSTTNSRQCTFTFGNIRIVATAGAGNIGSAAVTLSGAADFAGTATGNTLINITKNAGANSKLAFITQPTDAVAGVKVTPSPTVAVQDQYGNQTTSNAAIQIALPNSPGVLINGSSTQSVNASNGLATFGNVIITTAATGYVLRATSGTLTSADSSAFAITAASFNKLVFTTQPSNATATASISPAIVVQMQDTYSNLVPTSGTAIVMTIQSNPNSGTLSGTTTVNTTNGQASFSDLNIDKAGNAYSLKATGGGKNVTSNSFNITVGAAAALVFSAQPANTIAGQSMSTFSVQAQDAGGNNVTTNGIGVSLAFASNTCSGTLSGTTSVNTSNGLASFTTVSITRACTGYTLTASASGLTAATSSAFNITAAVANKLAFNVQPSDVAAAAAIAPSVTVQVQDTYGNLVSSPNVSVTIGIGTNPGGGTLSGTVTANSASGTATFNNLKINKSGTGYTLTATGGGLTAATSSTFNVTAGAASKLVYSVQPSNTSAGIAISPTVTVQVQDANSNVVTSSNASITMSFGTNAGSGTLSGTLTVAATNGVATFGDLNIDKPGTGYTIKATSGAFNVTSSTFNITVGPAAKLVFGVQPSTATAGATISPSVTVQVQDAGGNIVTGSSASISLTIASNPGSGTLSGTTTVSASSGVATFSTLSINKSGTGYTLTASSGSLTSATSSSFNINVGTASKLAFVQQPTNANANQTISPAVTVQIQDANGNATTSSATVSIAIGTNPGSGTLAGTVSAAASSGTATFSNLSINAGGVGYTLTATSSGLTSATSSSFTITAAAATKLAFSVQPSDSTPGNIITPSIVVQVQDASGAVVTGSSATVTLAIGSNPGSANITGTTSSAAVNGVATFSDIALTTLGTGYTLVASSSGLTSATSATFDIKSEICYTDPFTNLNNWSVGYESGTYGAPTAVSGRLRMTNASTSSSTYATLNKLFPASGNKVTVTFRYYSYGGSGADGVGVILSDASVAPVSGAFGGSLGYAPKTTAAGGDTTHPGFAGGWLGVGLDEFGNFSSNSEGRSGGSAPGVRTNAVAIRGSGSGYQGYFYMAGTNTLSPVLTQSTGHSYQIIVDHSDGVHAYTSVKRDTSGGSNFTETLIAAFDAKANALQATVPTNWFLSFAGSTGANTNIHEIENLQVCSPVLQSLTLHHVRMEYNTSNCGGGSAPILIKACANAACTSLYTGSVTVSVTASAGTLSGTNPTVSGTTISRTFTGGSNSISLAGTAGTTVTLSGQSSSPSITTLTCYTGSASEIACSNAAAPVVFSSNTACYNATEQYSAPGTRLLTKLVNTAFNMDVVALSGSAVDTSSTKTFNVSLVDPAATPTLCTSTSAGGGLTSETAYTFVAGDQGRKTFSFTYPNAVKNIRVRIRDSSGSTCSTDDFTIRPYAFSTTSSPTSATSAINGEATLFKAGTDTFTVTVSPVNFTNAAVTGYAGNPKVNVGLLAVSSGTAPAGVTLGTLATSPSVSTPPTFQTTATGTFTYNGVGTLFFANGSIYDDVWVDHDIANGDCNLNAYNNTQASGKYGCLFANTNDMSAAQANTFTAGRFIPDHFETVLTSPLNTGTPQVAMNCTGLTFFTPCPTANATANLVYGAEPFNATVTAYLKGGSGASGTGVATGYDGTYGGSRLTTLYACDTLGCSNTNALAPKGSLQILDSTTGAAQALSFSAASFVNGVATLTPTSSNQMSFKFTSAFTTPTNVYLRAIDTNNVTSLNSTPANSIEGGLKVISGRVRMFDATGSDLSDLPVSSRVEFWQENSTDGTAKGWTTNTVDTYTQVTLSNAVVSGAFPTCILKVYDGANKTGLGSCTATPVLSSRLFTEAPDSGFGGLFNIWVQAPSVAGVVDMTATVPAWLRYNWTGSGTLTNPVARLSFGTAKRSRVIYRQELYR